MSTATDLQDTRGKAPSVPAVAQPRLPYHPGLKERFGIGQSEWRALVESTFPTARSVGAVILALAYCKARSLDPFKKTVHIVPIWDKQRGCEVETVWPGIAEYRTTASRTGCYAGHDEIALGPMAEKTWQDTDKSGKSHGDVTVKFPEWAQLTVYRIVKGERCAFPGPKVYWLETYASKRNGCPNTMWTERPIGMISKCAEAAALRGAFPEELGGEPSYEEWGGFRWHGRAAIDVESEAPATPPQLEHERHEAETAPSPPQEPEHNTPPASGRFEEWRLLLDSVGDMGEVRSARESLANDDALTAAEKAKLSDLLDAKADGLGGRKQKRKAAGGTLPGMD